MYYLKTTNIDIAGDLHAFKFLKGANKMSFLRHIGVAELLLRCPIDLNYLEEEALDVFGVTHIQDVFF